MIAYLSWCNTHFDQRDVILLHGIEWRRRRGNVPKLRSCRAVEAQAGLGTWYRIGMYYTDSSMASGSKQDGLSHSIKVAILVPPRYSICLSTIMWTDRLHWAYFYGKAGCRSQPSDPSLCLLFYGVKKCDNFDFACLAPPVIMFFSISFWSGFHGFTRRPTYNASPKEHCAVHKSI